MTEREMLDRLHVRFSQLVGNGERWVRAEHVRNRLAFDANRTADFMAQDTWPSKGTQLHGVEVKVSRSDWLRELAEPDKAEAFKPYCDRWWLAIAAPSMVRPEEVPDGWGVLVPYEHGRGLRILRQAPRLTREPMPIEMCIALMRSVAKTAERQAARRAG